MRYPRVGELARHLHGALVARSLEDEEPLSHEMQLLLNMAPLVGLRGLVIFQVFWYHFHWTWPDYLWPLFTRCMDMEIFFYIMGITALIQHREASYGTWRELRKWWWAQWWKIFPVYWLALGVVALTPYYTFLPSPAWVQPDVTTLVITYHNVSINGTRHMMPVARTETTWSFSDYSRWEVVGETLLSIMGLQTLPWDFWSQSWFNLVFWFVGTMWIIFLSFPLLHYGVLTTAPRDSSRLRCCLGLGLCLVVYWLLWLYCNIGYQASIQPAARGSFFLQATPYVKVWIFVAGMFTGQLLVTEARGKDAAARGEKGRGVGWVDRLSGRGWGVVTDFAGLALGFLTFGPPYYPRLKDGTGLAWGYDNPIEQYVIMPLQLLTMLGFLYGVLHNRGGIAALLQGRPVVSFGTVVFPFYLLHYPVTMFTLSGSYVPYNTGKDAFPVDNTVSGVVFPLGGLALTYIAAYMVHEYYQPSVMRHIEPRMARLAGMLSWGGEDENGSAYRKVPAGRRSVDLEEEFGGPLLVQPEGGSKIENPLQYTASLEGNIY